MDDNATKKGPPWVWSGRNVPRLQLFNSLTNSMEVFVPKFGKQVKWYCCGPTVHDTFHMGHARTFITFDVLRRVVEDYFGFEVMFAMNITDIDDKIIQRARRKHLFSQYSALNLPVEQIISDTHEAVAMLAVRARETTDAHVKLALPTTAARVQSCIEIAENALKTDSTADPKKWGLFMLYNAKGALSYWLDRKYGKTVDNNNIFINLPRFWEKEFHKAMAALNILPPDVQTRASEYVPEIIRYIQKIIENGYAYVSGGSVYFDVIHFKDKPNHFYAKLVPEAFGDIVSLQSGEGELGEVVQKKSPYDFILWKASNAGEPSWESPWGKGRPGWHIQCSAMASEIFGDYVDIHTGGHDLKFPHNDNEIAQAEAYFDSDEWVRFFLHTGVLNMCGCKMTKTLKNSISITDILKRHSARQVRLAFLMNTWTDTAEFNDSSLTMATTYEKSLIEFFFNIQEAIRSAGEGESAGLPKKFKENDKALHDNFLQLKRKIHLSLCNNIDTKSVLKYIKRLVSASTEYMVDETNEMNSCLLRNIGSYVTQILTTFGVIEKHQSIGFPPPGLEPPMSTQDLIRPYANALCSFRQDVLAAGIKLNSKKILRVCEKLKKDALSYPGVYLGYSNGLPPARIENKNPEPKSSQGKKKRKRNSSSDKLRIPPDQIFLDLTDNVAKFKEMVRTGCGTDTYELAEDHQQWLQNIYETDDEEDYEEQFFDALL